MLANQIKCMKFGTKRQVSDNAGAVAPLYGYAYTGGQSPTLRELASNISYQATGFSLDFIALLDTIL